MTSVTIFNANVLPVSMQVNNGAQFQINAADPTTWVPATPASGGPTWSNTTKAPNVFAPGQNSLNIVPQGSTDPFNTTVTLPKNVIWNSLQLYIYFNSYSDVSWIVLNQGEFVTGNIQLPSSAVFAARVTEKA